MPKARRAKVEEQANHGIADVGQLKDGVAGSRREVHEGKLRCDLLQVVFESLYPAPPTSPGDARNVLQQECTARWRRIRAESPAWGR